VEARSFLAPAQGLEAVDQERSGQVSRPEVEFVLAVAAAASSGVRAMAAPADGPAASTTAFTSGPTG
jgi:hypothetical protein